LPESVGTFTAITSDTRSTIKNNMPSAEAAQIAVKRANILENFKLDYGNLTKVFSNPETSAAVNASVEAAWDKTLNAFSDIHQERVNILP
jgi:hypothetical protein